MIDLSVYVFDTICLSGLEGITLPEIWSFLTINHPYCLFNNLNVDFNMKKFIIKTIINFNNVAFFYVPQDVNQKEIYENFTEFNQKKIKFAIYNEEFQEYGVSKYYYHRVNVTNEVKHILSTFDNYVDRIEEKFGGNLYITANQKSRCSALNYYNVEKGDIVKYCIAEIIGRCREKGFEQIGLIDHCNGSETTYYEVNWLIFKKHIIKISHINNYPEIPQNLLILKRFYHQNKLFEILYINKSISSLFPYDYVINKAYEIIYIHHKLSILLFYQKIKMFYPEMIEFQFKNVILYLHRCDSIDILDSTNNIVDQKMIKNIFPLKKKYISEDIDSSYPDYWMKDNENCAYWLYFICLISINGCEKYLPIDTKKESITKTPDFKPHNNYYLKLKTPSFTIPFETNLMSTIFHIVNNKKQDGCTIKELVLETSTDFYMCRCMLLRLEKDKMLYTIKSIIGKVHTLRYYSMKFKNSSFDKIRAVVSNDVDEKKIGKCSIDIQAFINRYISNLKKSSSRIKYFNNNIKKERFNFIISYIEANNGILKNNHDLLIQLNEKEKDINYFKTTSVYLSKLIEDLIILKILNRYTLKISLVNDIIKLNVNTIFLKDIFPSNDNNIIVQAFFDELKSDIYKNNIKFVENEDLFTKISNCIQNDEVFHFNDCGDPYNNSIQNLSDLDQIWVEEEYMFLRRLIDNNLYNSQFFPKFVRAKYFHFYLCRLIYGLDIKNTINTEDSSNNKIIQKNPWLKAVNIIDNHINGKGWFTVRDAINNMPFILFIKLILPSLTIDQKYALIEMKHLYFVPYSVICTILTSVDENLLFIKFNLVVNLLFVLRLIGSNLNSAVQYFRKSSLYLLPNVSMYDSSGLEYSLHFNSLDDLNGFWKKLKTPSINPNLFNLSFFNSKSKAVNEFSYRSYLIKSTTNKEKLIIYHLEKDGVFGFNAGLNLQLSRNWIFNTKRTVLKCEETYIPILIKPIKRKHTKISQKDNLKKIFFSSKMEKLLLMMEISIRLKKMRIKKSGEEFQSMIKELLNITYQTKYIQKLFGFIRKNFFLNRFIEKILLILKKTESNKNLENTSVTEIYNTIVLIECEKNTFLPDICDPLFNKNHKIIHLTYPRPNKLFVQSNDFIHNEKTISSFYSKIILLSFLLKSSLFDIQITDRQIEMFYNYIGPIQALKTLDFFEKYGYFVKYPMLNSSDFDEQPDLIDFKDIFRQYFSKMSLMIKNILSTYFPCRNSIPDKTNESNNNIFLSIAHLYFNSKIKIIYSSKKNNANILNSFSIQLETFNDNLVICCLPESAHNQFNFEINIFPIENSLDFSCNINSTIPPSFDYPTICQKSDTIISILFQIIFEFINELLKYLENNNNSIVSQSSILAKLSEICKHISLNLKIALECFDLCVECQLILYREVLCQKQYFLSNNGNNKSLNLTHNYISPFIDDYTEDIDIKSFLLIKQIIYGYIMKYPGTPEINIINELSKALYMSDIKKAIKIMVEENHLIEINVFNCSENNNSLFKWKEQNSKAYIANLFI